MIETPGKRWITSGDALLALTLLVSAVFWLASLQAQATGNADEIAEHKVEIRDDLIDIKQSLFRIEQKLDRHLTTDVD